MGSARDKERLNISEEAVRDIAKIAQEAMMRELLAAGWRKMPSAAELTDCIISVDDQRDTDVLVAAILDLLEGEERHDWPPPLDSEPSALYNIEREPTNG
jgi:hypothetical protein